MNLLHTLVKITLHKNIGNKQIIGIVAEDNPEYLVVEVNDSDIPVHVESYRINKFEVLTEDSVEYMEYINEQMYNQVDNEIQSFIDGPLSQFINDLLSDYPVDEMFIMSEIMDKFENQE